MSPSAPGPPVSSGFFVWRTPALPFDQLLAWSRSLRAPAAGEDRERLTAALAADRLDLRTRLRALLERPDVREALFVASPDLDERLHVWLRDPEGDKGRRVESAVVRYVERMAARPTPFGLFSGCSLGTMETGTRLEIEAREHYRRHSRLDMHYLSGLAEELERAPELRERLLYRPNSSLYRAAGRYRYAEGRLSGGGRSYHLVAVDVTDYLETALTRAHEGAVPAEIARAICRQRPDVTPDEAEEFVGELIDSQILASDLSPLVTGDEPIADLIAALRPHPATSEAATILAQTRIALRQMDGTGAASDAERYRTLAEGLEALPARVEMSRLVQVDLVKPAGSSSLGDEPMSELLRGIEILRRFEGHSQTDDLARFRDAFISRYEAREMPLVEVLDEEVGIGFGSPDRASTEAAPLLADVGLQPPARGDRPGVTWRGAHGVLLEKLVEAAADGADEIALGEEDLQRMSAPTPRSLPHAFAVTAVLAAASSRDLSRGDFRILLNGGGGPSGARVLGRFCHADEALHRAVEDHLRAEEAHEPDAIFAEVVHLPEGRLGNILFRPVLRGYEIPFLGRSGAPRERQIPVTDLLVSVSRGRVVLRSARLRREVVPRLTSAHNFTHRSLPVYRFLCSLQSQSGAPWLAWSWGPLRDAAFLPRVRSGRLVLSRARWTVPADELAPLAKEGATDRFLRVRRWRETRRIPRFVLLSDADNELLVDLDNTLSIDAFADVVKNRPGVTLTEMFPQPEELAATGPEGRFVHEMVIPFVLSQEKHEDHAHAAKSEQTRHGPAMERPGAAPAERTFSPGSEWLYAKIYAGASTADRILRDAVAPVARAAMDAGAAGRWFFIRYADPEWHLRVRFRGAPERLTGEILPALHAALEPLRIEGQLWRLQLDTYEREMERYGAGNGIDLLEEAFRIDSEAVLEIIGMLGGDDGADARWRLALYGLDRLLEDLGFDTERKLALARRRREAFGHEFGADKGLRIRLGNKFRSQRKDLDRLLAYQGEDEEEELGPGLAVLQARSLRLAPLAARLRDLDEAGHASHEGLAIDLGHMFVNRLLLTAHRAQELVLWDFLERVYESRVARARSALKRASASTSAREEPRRAGVGAH